VVEFRLIRHALALGRHRNFARAAESLRLTQPTLSRSIAMLERELGVRLFDRTSEGARPTAFGELLLQRGATLLDGEAEFRREIQLLAGLESGTLRVGLGPYPAEISVGMAAGRLMRKHPRLGVELLCADPDQIIRGVLAGHYDVGVCAPVGIGDIPRLRFAPLPCHPIFLACRPGHPLAGRRGVTLDQVLDYPLVTTMLAGVPGVLAGSRRSAGRYDEDRNLFRPAVHVNVLTLARQIAAETDALLPATTGMIAREEADGLLVRLPFHVPEMCTQYGILTLADRSIVPAAAAFLDLLRAVESEVAASEVAKPVPRKSVGRRLTRRTAEATPG
jgi:DNA-binding transcriptional LysR family regulator